MSLTLAPNEITGPSRPVLRWHGGKYLLAPWIIQHFPEHRVYVEPFGGAASVLIRKPRAYAEVYNDLDGEVVNVFRMLQRHRSELERLLRATPFAREEFVLSYLPDADPLEQARRTIIRSFMGFGSSAHNRATGFRSNSNRSGTTPARDWLNYPEALAFFEHRLQGVVLEHRPAAEVICQQDGEQALIYADPPYPFGTRSGAADDYRHEMSDDDHRELAGTLRAAQGLAVLSGYACELYDCELYPDWRRVTRKAHADGARDRTEALWLSPRTWDALNSSRAQQDLFAEATL